MLWFQFARQFYIAQWCRDVMMKFILWFQFARQFYIAQWYRDGTMEVEKAAKKLTEEKKKESKKGKKKRRRHDSEDEEGDGEPEDEDEDGGKGKSVTAEFDAVKEIQTRVELRKSFLMDQIGVKVGAFATFK